MQVKSARRSKLTMKNSAAQTRLLSMKTALLPFGAEKLETYVEKVTMRMISQNIWPRFVPSMERVEARAAEKAKLQKEMKAQLTVQLTEQLTQQLVATLTPTIAESLRESLITSVCDMVAAKVMDELGSVIESMDKLKQDWSNALNGATAQNVRSCVS